MKKLLLLLVFGLCSHLAQAQYFTKDVYSSDTLNRKRLTKMILFKSSVYAGSLGGLYFMWYAGYEKSRFHFIDDSYGWLQIDKYGHSTATYHVGIFCYNMNRWAGLDEKKAIWYAVLTSSSYQAFIEVFDGHSAAWGASLTDLAANTAGTALFLSQQLAWQEQRIKLKYSFRPMNYSHLDEYAQQRTKALFGESIFEQWLKDYNGQGYWLSANLAAFGFDKKWWPQWLNVAFGYGAENMLGANWNIWQTDDCYFNYEHLPRYRQYFLSLDVDFEKIPIKSKFYKTIAPYLNFIKIPAPAFEYNGLRQLKGHILYY